MVKKIPKCIGIIMDGNRRWAKQNNLSVQEGHNAGADKLKNVAEWSKELGIENIIVYAFSTENWNRSEKEVSFLMILFEKFILESLNDLKKEEIKISFVGQRERFSQKIQDGMKRLEEETSNFSKSKLFIAISYGGRAEIISAINKVLKETKKEGEITEDNFRKYLWTNEMPDPEIIIRTGGDHRLSNFLSWQSAYSELFFINTFWPDFSKKELINVLGEFSERERRNGK